MFIITTPDGPVDIDSEIGRQDRYNQMMTNVLKEKRTMKCKFYQSTCQGRDFVVQHPETNELFEGYFSGEQMAIATYTTDGNDLKFVGQYAKLQEKTRNIVNVYFS